MLFLSSRRDLINWFLKNEVTGYNHSITGQVILKKYKELQLQDKMFCKQVFKDECYEKYWILGKIDGVVTTYKDLGVESSLPADIKKYADQVALTKRFVQGTSIIPSSVKAPANALSRLCGELANMHHEGLLHKVGRGIYCIRGGNGVPSTKNENQKKEEQILVSPTQLSQMIEEAVSKVLRSPVKHDNL